MKTVWEHLPKAERPFDWATPMDNYAAPWRVPHSERGQRLLERALGEMFPDIYATPHPDARGRKALWVGLRGFPEVAQGGRASSA